MQKFKVFSFVFLAVAVTRSASAEVGALSAEFFKQNSSVGLYSESAIGLGADQNQFMTLKAMFTQASIPSPMDVRGWTSGRCYTHLAPGTPTAQLLVGLRKDQNDDGPNFPPRELDKIISIYMSDSSADFFDNMSQETKRSVAAVVRNESTKVGEVRSENGSLVSRYDGGNLDYRIKKHGDYLLMEAALLRDSGEIKAGGAYCYCYYFKKVL